MPVYARIHRFGTIIHEHCGELTDTESAGAMRAAMVSSGRRVASRRVTGGRVSSSIALLRRVALRRHSIALLRRVSVLWGIAALSMLSTILVC